MPLFGTDEPPTHSAAHAARRISCSMGSLSLATSIGTKTQKTLVASEVGTGIGNTSATSDIYSLAYIDSAGAKGIMLVNKGVGAVAVELADIKSGLARVVEVNVDVAEPGFEPIVKRTVGADGMLSLGPLAVAIVTGIV